jgi:Zn-finger nucleic acid-binding protein
MAAMETLNCPMCGAPASTDAPHCDHCGARLATVACPSCFGMMFLGEKYCSHCGAKAERTEVASTASELCPRCRTDLNAVVVGTASLRECPRCEGIWADRESLQQIYANQEKQAAVLGLPTTLPSTGPASLEQNIRYVPCPVCRKLMNRVNFANCSHVIVDVCKQHGAWFDRDELRRIVEFIRGGGLEKARSLVVEKLEESRREAQTERVAGAWLTSQPSARDSALDYGSRGNGISAVAEVISSLLGY